MDNSIHYALIIDDDRFDLESHITIGRHLDNDLVVAGEDVLDFHARLELRDRGPWLARLNDAPLHVNRISVKSGIGLVPDDEIILGQHVLTLVAENSGAYVMNWRLISRGGSSSIRLAEQVLVGRSADCDLCISEGFVSRRHALLYIRSNLVWLRDLDSSNGTFVNGDRIDGAVHLLHGDEVAFDTSAFQLVGEAEHLTPVIEYPGQFADSMSEPSDLTESAKLGPAQYNTPLVSTIEIAPVPMGNAIEKLPPSSLKPGGNGAAVSVLVGMSDPVLNETFPLTLGRYLLGRDVDSDIQLHESSVSGKHAELDIRLEGAYLTNLIATNGTLVNAEQVQTQKLKDNDIIDLGRVRLVYQEARSNHTSQTMDFRLPLTLVVGSLVFISSLVWYLYF
ncbi:MAG: FHA domain-containing protein [Pseudomonadales bacterium]|nr:FHA domain-containing protein [Pseudomonadales bacterium]